MFYRNKENIVATLEKLRQDVCCYMSPTFCDCKYGYESKGKFNVHHGEHTACPELRCALAVLNKMTDAEYEEIINRKMAAADLNIGIDAVTGQVSVVASEG